MAAETSGAVFLSISQTFGMFGSFLPSFAEVRRADKSDPEFIKDVRMGEAAAVGLCLGVGAVAASFANSNAPILAALFTAAALVAVYEYALRSEGSENGKSTE